MNSSAIVTVNPLPTAPTAGDVNIPYDGLLHTGTAAAPGGSSVVWYDAETGGNVTVAPSGTNVGTYTAWAESVDDGTACYSDTRTLVTVTITIVPLTITANNDTKEYDGLAYSGGNGVTYDGFVNGETATVLGGTLAYVGTSQGAINFGTYVITPEGLTSDNYDITFVAGSLNITKAPLTITAIDDTKVYDGLAYSGGNGITYDGFVNGETSAVLGGMLTYGGNSQGAINVGFYVITPDGMTSTNYDITFVDGELSITPVTLGLKVLLQGPYNIGTGLMKTDLYDNGQLPSGQPFNVAPWNYSGGEMATPGSTSVDWVLVELRSDENTIAGRKAALLNNDGTLSISINDVSFPGVIAGSDYYIVIWHRNHMPVMSASAVTLPVTSYELTVLSNLYGTNPAFHLGDGVYAMVAGDVTKNGILKYSGPDNDRGPIIARIVAETGSNNTNGFTDPGYWQEDVSMNSIILYIGSVNDRAFIVDNLATLTGTPYLNNTYSSEVPGALSIAKDGTNNGPINIQFTETNENLAVEIITNEFVTNGMVDNIQFTLAWKTDDYEMEALLSTMNSSFNLMPQGIAVEVDGINYLTCVSVTPTFLPQAWNEGDQITVMAFEKEYGQMVSNRLWIADNEFTQENNGEYYVSNWGSDATGMINTLAVGTDNTNEGFVKIYPNPVNSGKLYVQINTTPSENLVTEIIDMRGKLIKKFENDKVTGTMTLTIDVSGFSTGVYLINVTGANVHFNDKFIVK
jgi:hypothetical protein